MLCFISTRLNEPTSAQQIYDFTAFETWEVRIDKKVAEQATEKEMEMDRRSDNGKVF